MQKLLNLPTLVLFSFLIRILITGASIGDAISLLGLAALYSYHLYIDSKKQHPVNKVILDRISDLEDQVRVAKESVNAVKLAASFRK